MDERLKGVTQEKANIEKMLQTKTGSEEGLQSELSELNETVSNQTSKIEELESMVSELENTNNSMTSEMEQKDSSIAKLRETIEEMTAAIEEKDKLIEKYKPPERPKPEPGKITTTTIPWRSGQSTFKCPVCGGNRVEDVEDKSKVLYVAAGTPIYEKLHRCLDCGNEWREEEV